VQNAEEFMGYLGLYQAHHPAKQEELTKEKDKYCGGCAPNSWVLMVTAEK
jgi:hypothetical protein